MPLNTGYSPSIKAYFEKVEAGKQVEEWEEPFVCDSCGGYFHGGELSAKSENQLLCHECAA